MYFLNVGGLVTQKFKPQKFIMQKIRIKKTPRAGDQRDYSLVHRQAQYISEGVPTDTPVKNTMGAVPREEANIEVEGGETVVGDVNNDGFLEHMTFAGKRHSEGGVPVNIPEGSFIFSDTKKLKIKDKEALKTMFGLPYKKGGYTPAEIAKRYQVNNYIDDLKNPESDEITKRSATKMLQNNMEKLGMLALMQESMKGFPDGVPAIAESAMAGLQGQAGAEEQPAEMRNGGLVHYQTGGKSKTTGNKKLDSLIEDYKKNPSEEKAKSLIETIESSYPEKGADMFFSPFWYAGNAIDNSYAKDVYFQAKRFGQKPYDGRNDIQKDRDLAKSIKPQAMQTLQKMKEELAANKENLLPFEIRKMESNIKNLESNIAQGKGTLVKAYMEKANPATASQKTESAPSTGSSATPPKLTYSSNSNSNTITANSTGSKPFVYTSDVEKKMKEQVSADEGEMKTLLEKPFTEFVGKKQGSATTTTKPAASKPQGSLVGKVVKLSEIEDATNYRNGGYYQEGSTVKEEPKTESTPKKQNIGVGKVNGKPVVYRVNPDGTSTILFEVYTGANKTPGGNNESFQGGIEDLKKYVGSLAKSNVDLSGIKNASDFQSIIYDQLLEKNPTSIIDMWSKEGQTIKGNKNPELRKKLETLGVKTQNSNKGYTLDFSNLNDEQKKQAALLLKEGYVDNNVGTRTLGYLPKEAPPVEKPVTPEEPKKDTPTTNPPKTETPKKEDKNQPPAPTPKKKSGNWWLQDIVNFTGTLTDDVNRYEPTQGEINLQTPGYATLDPTRRLAANQESFARLQNMTENTTDGNVGLAAMTGAQGQAFANAANAIGEVENANVGIVNNAYAQNANIMNQEAGANEAGRQKYVEDMATLNQQYDNALKQKKWREIAAFNNGTTNWFRKKQMEQVLFPDVYVDPLSGDVSVDPSKRDVLDPQTYSPAYGGGRNGAMNDYGLGTWRAIYDSVKDTMGDAEAKRHATNMVELQMKNANAGSSRTQAYGQAVGQGNTLGSHSLPGNAFGGTVDYPWIDLD